MEKHLSIVPSKEVRNYRRLAQLHYGLTNEQMKGVHVHHNPSRSSGGRNIAEHLYVYSLENHDYAHGGDGFVIAGETNRKERCVAGGTSCFVQGKGAHDPEVRKLTQERRKEKISKETLSAAGSKGAKVTVEKQLGLHDPKNKQKCIMGSRKGGAKVVKSGLGIHSPDYKVSIEHQRNRKRVGQLNAERLKKKVMCVETGEIFNSCGEAQDFLKIKGCGVSKSARSNGEKSCGGFHWVFIT